MDCIIAGIEEQSSLLTTKRSKRDQVSPEKKKHHASSANQMWCGKCGVSHQPNEPCKYPDVPKSLWCSSCGSRQNDHVKGCSAEKGAETTFHYCLSVCARDQQELHGCLCCRRPFAKHEGSLLY